MLLATLTFRVQPYKRAEALSALDFLTQRMRGTAGCARSRILTDSDDQNVLIIASEWQDAAAADAFFNSREFQIFKGIRMLMRDEPYIVMDEVRARVTRLMRAS